MAGVPRWRVQGSVWCPVCAMRTRNVRGVRNAASPVATAPSVWTLYPVVRIRLVVIVVVFLHECMVVVFFSHYLYVYYYH